MKRNNKPFLSLNFIMGKSYSCGSKGVLRNCNFWYDPKLGPGIVAIRKIPYIFHNCTAILSLSFEKKYRIN